MAAPDDDPHRTLTAAGSGAPAAAREPRREPGDIRPGDRFSRYIVQRLIGEGGMGRVFAAVDTQLGRTIALKVINRRHLESPTSRPRLLREAQALALLHHPNVVTVHDIGSEVDRVFIAMELVEGPTLSTWLKAAPRTWRDTLRTLLAAGRGLAAAHAASIIHRDFKPANVIVGHDRVVVVDFGLARAGDDAPGAAVSSRAETVSERERVSEPAIDHAMLEVSLTEHGARIGTAGYMAPEQLGGRPVTGKVDQFAFCVALWEALWGARPLPPGVGIDDDHAPPAVALAGVPSRVRDIVSRGLAADPAQRWPDLPALLAALERCLVRRSRIAIGAVLLGAALAVGVAGWIIERGHAERRLAAAQQLAREAEVVRGHMRASRLLPPHDIEIDRQAVRAQIARITEEMAAIGDDARGPGEFALGAAWLSLGDGRDVRAQALVHLEAAWAAGERSPELAFDLGSALARTYQDALLRVPPVAERAQLEADLQHRLRDPALVYLRQARGADTSPDFLEALIAVTEGRWDDAIARGEAALREVPTLYEAGLLVAHALQKQANAAMVAGAPAQADGLYDRMAAMYRRVVDTGRSDDKVYQQAADFLGGMAYRRSHDGRDVEADLEHVRALIAQGRQTDSRATWPDELESRTDDMLGLNAWRHQREPRGFFQAAIAAAERAARRDPSSARPQLYLGNAWGDLVDAWETPHGVDPRASLEKSIAAYRAASKIEPDPDTFQNLGVSLDVLAHWQLAHGLDDEANVDEAVASAEAAHRMAPADAVSALPLACTALVEHGRGLLAIGRDPAPWLARAQAPCEALKRELPGSSEALSDSADYGWLQASLAARTDGDPEPGWQRAVADNEDALAHDHTNQGPRIAIARVLADRAEYALGHPAVQGGAASLDRALREARDAIAHDAGAAAGHAALARVALVAARVARHAGRDAAPAIAEGSQAAARALAITPDAGPILLVAAELDLLAGRRDAGLARVTRALAINPRNTRALVIRAGFERLAGHADAAAATLRDALAAGPLLAGDPAI